MVVLVGGAVSYERGTPVYQSLSLYMYLACSLSLTLCSISFTLSLNLSLPLPSTHPLTLYTKGLRFKTKAFRALD